MKNWALAKTGLVLNLIEKQIGRILCFSTSKNEWIKADNKMIKIVIKIWISMPKQRTTFWLLSFQQTCSNNRSNEPHGFVCKKNGKYLSLSYYYLISLLLTYLYCFSDGIMQFNLEINLKLKTHGGNDTIWGYSFKILL